MVCCAHIPQISLVHYIILAHVLSYENMCMHATCHTHKQTYWLPSPFFPSTGQFWNIALFYQPATVTLPTYIRNPQTYFEVNITSASNPDTTRNFLATMSRYTWDKSEEECLYAGTAQGGRSGEVPEINDPVIEGRYHQYQLEELFATSYEYSQFEENRCSLN